LSEPAGRPSVSRPLFFPLAFGRYGPANLGSRRSSPRVVSLCTRFRPARTFPGPRAGRRGVWPRRPWMDPFPAACHSIRLRLSFDPPSDQIECVVFDAGLNLRYFSVRFRAFLFPPPGGKLPPQAKLSPGPLFTAQTRHLGTPEVRPRPGHAILAKANFPWGDASLCFLRFWVFLFSRANCGAGLSVRAWVKSVQV